MEAPENRVAVIKSLQEEKVQGVRLLGYGLVDYQQALGILVVKLPKKLPVEYTNCLEITVEE